MGVAPMIAFLGVIFLLVIVMCVFMLACLWKIFSKAGLPGWIALIPIYNTYKLMEITWGVGWLFLVLIVPGANLVFGVATYMKLAKAFGMSPWIGALALFFPIICIPIIAFGGGSYTGPSREWLKGCAIASGVLFAIWILMIGVCIALGMSTAILGLTYGDVIDKQIERVDPTFDGYPEDGDLFNNDGTDYTGKDIKGEESKGTVELFSGNVETVEMDNGYATCKVPYKSTPYSYSTPTAVGYSENGVKVEILYHSVPEVTSINDLVAQAEDKAGSSKRVFENMPEWYKNVTDEPTSTEGGYANKIVRYEDANTSNPGYTVVRAYDASGYPLVVTIEVDKDDFSYSEATENEILSMFNTKL